MLKGTYKFLLTPANLRSMMTPEELEEHLKKPLPPPPPHHYITFTECNGIPVGILETEHGKQIVSHLCYSTDIIRFTALAGTPGDELFFYAITLTDGILEGEAYRAGFPHSVIKGELISEN